MSSYYEPEIRFGFGGGITYAVQVLLLVSIIAFAAQLLVDIPLGDIHVRNAPGGTYALEWLEFSPGKFLSGFIWQPLTYMFLHGHLMHLFTNMLMLYFFGPEVERILGTRQFLWFYLACGAVGVMANYVPIVLLGMPAYPVVGASGACLGVLVAFAVVQPHRQIFLFPFPVPIPAVFLVAIFVVLNLITAVGGGSNTSVATHFGGMLVAFVYMKGKPKVTAWRIRRRPRRRRRPVPSGEDEEKLKRAIDNIFKFQNRGRDD